MSFEDQLGALASKLAQARADLEASIQHAQDTLHKRVDTLTGSAATDIRELHEKFKEMEDGVVRHRDQTLQALQGEMNRLRSVEDVIRQLPALVAREVALAEDRLLKALAPKGDTTADDDGQGGSA